MRSKLLVLAIAIAVGCPAFAADTSKSLLTLEALRAKYGDTHGRIAVIKGIEVYYKDEGRGPVILMVHGSQSTLKTWDHVAPLLTRHYRVIRFDIPPQGLSGRVLMMQPPICNQRTYRKGCWRSLESIASPTSAYRAAARWVSSWPPNVPTWLKD